MFFYIGVHKVPRPFRSLTIPVRARSVVILAYKNTVTAYATLGRWRGALNAGGQWTCRESNSDAGGKLDTHRQSYPSGPACLQPYYREHYLLK